MTFEIDNQTKQDLNLFSKYDDSIFQFLNYTNTKKGELTLIKNLEQPLSNLQVINDRIETIQYFYDHDLKFNILQKDVEFIEHYISLDFKCLKDSFFDALHDKTKSFYSSKNNYYLIERGITALIKLFNIINEELLKYKIQELPNLLNTIFSELDKILKKEHIASSLKLNKESIGFRQRNTLDQAFRNLHKNDITKLLDLIYEWDVLQSLKLAMKKNNFNLPKVSSTTNEPILEFTGLFHPILKKPIKNNLKLNSKSNLCFLTGPNMSGKSTILKAIGISVLLSHMGFPIPAEKMEISLFKGIITSINLSDNINLGYSHYFSEVKRIKYITEQLDTRKHIFVIIDEMFRGTNVEESHFGTHVVSSAFSNIPSSLFFVSSHIVEVAQKFSNSNYISLKYLEGNLNDSENNYKLKTGISSTKLGRKILENEGVIEKLNSLSERV